MTWTGIRIRGTDNLIIFESEEILWNQKSRDESKAAFIWKERRDTKHIVNEAREDRSKKES